MTTYDENNIFAKIIKGEIPCNKIYEDKYTLAFNDINPIAPIHVLVIPKGKYISWDDFSQSATTEEITALVQAIGKIGKQLTGNNGYRLISNHGKDSNQEVPHLHFHIIGGKSLGPLINT